ncbi:PREDICTED: uncharacterized protein C20orf173 homolog [Capra hircus]|uniref:uncharacterized protein C20orf173 homolog n=1 Tax=Capra hircus TaxID=9925 RepID=UPI0006B137F6|nr:PREDICTED: uncharacterized protein C20orf173 homolog [Capra hircus]
MDREVGDEGLAGGVVWRSGEPRRPTGQRGGGLSMTSGPHPSQSQVEEPVGRLPLEPSPGPDRRHWWQIFVLCIFWMLLLWLMTPCLNLKTDSAPQEKWMDGAPQHCSCPWFKFWQCGCPPGSLNHSVCHHTAGERWFDAGYEKMRGSLMGEAESTRPGAVLWWSDLNAASELRRVWEKLLKVIPRPSVSHFDLFCGTCALMGNSKILQAASLSNNVNRPNMVSRNARGQRSWRQVLLLLLQLFDLAWTSDALSEEMVVFLLDQKSSQNDLRKMPRNSSKTCECPQNSLRKCICSSEVHEYSTCLGIPGEPVWLDEHFEMDVEPLIRMNQAPVQGFEADVGKRTTVRITYPKIDSP